METACRAYFDVALVAIRENLTGFPLAVADSVGQAYCLQSGRFRSYEYGQL